jgi:hypothetical protein
LRLLGSCVGALVFTAVASGVTRANAQVYDPWAARDSGVTAGSKPSSTISVTFAPSAHALPQAEIRAAIARELERRPSDAPTLAGDLEIAIEGDHLLARFRSPEGYAERILPMPEDRSQVAVMLGLVAGNLARDQRSLVRTRTSEAGADTVGAPPESKPARTDEAQPDYHRHHFGLHVGQDFAVVGGSNVCHPSVSTTVACFHEGTDVPYAGAAHPDADTVPRHLRLGTTRVLLSYDGSLFPELSLGARFGFALGGAPSASGVGAPDSPEDAPYTAAASVFRGHFEVRLTYWFWPLARGHFHAFLGFSGGVAEVDVKSAHSVIDCATYASSSGSSDPTATYAACRQGVGPALAPNTKLDAWTKARLGFVGGHGGVTYSLTSHVEAALNVTFLYFVATPLLSVEPSLGVVYSL